jgi:hypothetical protein
MERGMDDWDGFYTLAGSTAGTLIGLIFVVITLGIEHTQEGDEHRLRLFITPVLVYFTSLLVIAMVMVPPLSAAARAIALGAIGSAGLAYVMNLFLLSRRTLKFEGPRIIFTSWCRSSPTCSSRHRPPPGRLKRPSPMLSALSG